MKLGRAMKYRVILEKGPGTFCAYAPQLPGCAVVGETRDEALELIREAIALYLESWREQGSSGPERDSSIECAIYEVIHSSSLAARVSKPVSIC
jgi:predicted RNase H-like HicB family nuclease